MSTKLPAQMQKTAGISNGMRTATIAAVVGTTVTISISGGLITNGVGVVSSYVPRVGDTVSVFRQDSSWLILGRNAGSNRWTAFKDLGYLNSWTDRANGIAPIGQFRIVGDSVQIVGGLSNPAATAPAAILPSGSLPPAATEAILPGSINAVNVRIVVFQSGALSITDIPTVPSAPTILQFCCTYPLDARLT